MDKKMLRFRVKELIAEKEFRDNRRITQTEVADACGINRMTLSKIAGKRGYNTVTDNLDALCQYFKCSIADLVVYIPESAKMAQVQNNTKSVTAREKQGLKNSDSCVVKPL